MLCAESSKKIPSLFPKGTGRGDFPDKTTRALPKIWEDMAGFQAKRGLPDTGRVDQATWNALVAMTRTPTAGELNDQAKATPTPGRPGSKPPTAGEIDQRCMTGRVICISKRTNSLRSAWYTLRSCVRPSRRTGRTRRTKSG